MRSGGAQHSAYKSSSVITTSTPTRSPNCTEPVIKRQGGTRSRSTIGSTTDLASTTSSELRWVARSPRTSQTPPLTSTPRRVRRGSANFDLAPTMGSLWLSMANRGLAPADGFVELRLTGGRFADGSSTLRLPLALELGNPSRIPVELALEEDGLLEALP